MIVFRVNRAMSTSIDDDWFIDMGNGNSNNEGGEENSLFIFRNRKMVVNRDITGLVPSTDNKKGRRISRHL